jgi:nicotinate-nucleotide adenylyltransferase
VKVGIFGGSFNPPHVSHVLAVTQTLLTSGLDEVLVVPTFQHPFAKALAPYDDRVAMCELAFGWLPRVRVSRVEEELGGESRTLRTLEHLAAKHPEWSMRFVMGADLVRESPRWFGFDRIAALAPPFVLGRGGIEGDDVPGAQLPAMSSTDVRTLLEANDEASTARLEQLLPRTVLAYVQERGLYRPALTSSR